MSGRFIGSRTIDERRRRRLVCEALPVVPPTPIRAVAEQKPAVAPMRVAPGESGRFIGRVSSFIRPQPWKSWAAVAVAALGALGLLWAGFVIDRDQSATREVLGLAAGHTCRYFAATMLVSVIQLSMLILWYRTRSRKDFHGRYRVWIWSCIAWPLFLTAMFTDCHITMSRRLVSHSPGLQAVFGESLWILPAVILFATTFRIVLLDMSNCAVSRWLLRGAAAFATAALSLRLLPDSILGRWDLLAIRSLSCIWPLLLAASYLHHARYVIYVTNEVHPLKKRRTTRLAGLMQESVTELWGFVPSRERVIEKVQAKRRLGQAGRLLLQLLTFLGRRTGTTAKKLSGLVVQKISSAGGAAKRLQKPARERPVKTIARKKPLAAAESPTPPEVDAPLPDHSAKEPSGGERVSHRVDSAHALQDPRERKRAKDRRLQRTLR